MNIFNRKPILLFTLSNSNGIKVQITNYGAKIVSAFVPDRNGKFENVVLGYTSLDHYLKGHPYLGATIGRVTNRIGNAKFEMDGHVYHLAKNHGEHHIHGGFVGFDSLHWEVTENKVNEEIPSVEFQIISPDGEQGYPGNITVKVRYSLLNDNSLKVDYTAITDKPTIVNMTNHAYFNLNHDSSENIYKHKAKFLASSYLEADINSIPSGRTLKVDSTPLDFRQAKEIGLEINNPVEPILRIGGYDQFLILDNYQKGEMNLMAEIEEPVSGRILQVLSTLPGMQFYSSNFLDTIFPMNNGKVSPSKHSSFCIEPSYFPDAPNHPEFQSIRLNVDESYNETIVYKFLTDNECSRMTNLERRT